MEYNTQRKPLLLREYGRNVQRMANYLMELDDKEKRNSYAATLVHLMKNINPNVKDGQEYEQKVWDDLYIISDFKLDVEGPFPKPEPNILDRKPDRVNYNKNEIKYRHFGRSIEILIDKACVVDDPLEKESAIITIGKLMKTFFEAWNKENAEDEIILKTIKRLSDGKLDIDIEKVKEFRLFDVTKTQRDGDKNRRGGGGRRHHKGGKRKRRN